MIDRREISHTQLGVILRRFINHLHNDGRIHESYVFQMLYLYGFRIRELKHIPSWEIENNHFVARTNKNGVPRRFLVMNVPEPIRAIIIRSINTNTNFLYQYKYKHYYDNAKMYFGMYRLQIKEGEQPTHVFRHHFIHYHFGNGKSIEWIKEFLGVVKNETIAQYLSSMFYVAPL